MSDENPGEPDLYRPKRIDPAFASKVTDHINRLAVAPNDACAVCGHPHNMVASTYYRLTAQPDEEVVASNTVMPLVATACYNCGFVRLFSEILVRQMIEACEKTEASRAPSLALEGRGGG